MDFAKKILDVAPSICNQLPSRYLGSLSVFVIFNVFCDLMSIAYFFTWNWNWLTFFVSVCLKIIMFRFFAKIRVFKDGCLFFFFLPQNCLVGLFVIQVILLFDANFWFLLELWMTNEHFKSYKQTSAFVTAIQLWHCKKMNLDLNVLLDINRNKKTHKKALVKIAVIFLMILAFIWNVTSIWFLLVFIAVGTYCLHSLVFFLVLFVMKIPRDDIFELEKCHDFKDKNLIDQLTKYGLRSSEGVYCDLKLNGNKLILKNHVEIAFHALIQNTRLPTEICYLISSFEENDEFDFDK